MKIFVNGTFDILHRGHLELLNFAKGLGDYLCVGIDTDERVKEKKGLTRPIHNQDERKFFLENLKAVDEVRLFSSDEELEGLIKSFKPDIMVVGSDWKGKSVIGSY
jgi:D-beta-D-heptose 7-phosphate kinase/D-beta-D-heptose 1-phosphate adenosyltransferase